MNLHFTMHCGSKNKKYGTSFHIIIHKKFWPFKSEVCIPISAKRSDAYKLLINQTLMKLFGNLQLNLVSVKF